MTFLFALMVLRIIVEKKFDRDDDEKSRETTKNQEWIYSVKKNEREPSKTKMTKKKKFCHFSFS